MDRDGNPLGGLGFDNGSYITGEFYDVQKGSILIDPARLDFEDNVICGWSATKTVTVSNVGAGPVQLGKLSISDSDTDGQTMFLKGNSCDNAILKAGASCTFRVASQLASQGNVIGQVIIPSDVLGEAHIIDLSGNGICWFSFLTNFPLPEWVTGWVCHSSSTGIVH